MRVLLDTCVWGGAKKILETAGHEVVWVGELTTDPGDENIIQQAFQEKRILVTLDKDFGELAIFKGYPHYGIVRLVNFPGLRQGEVCLQMLERYEQELHQGAILTVETSRIRIRSKYP